MTGNSAVRATSSVRLRQVWRLVGALNNLGERIAQRLGKGNAHPQPSDNGYLCGVGAIDLTAPQGEIHYAQIMPVLENQVGEYRRQSVGQNGELSLAYRQYLARLQANLVNHVPLPGPESLGATNNLDALNAQNLAANDSAALGLMSQQASGAIPKPRKRSWLRHLAHWLSDPLRAATALLAICVAAMWLATGRF